MSDVIKQGWIIGGATVLAAVLGALVGKSIWDEATVAKSSPESLWASNDSLLAENKGLRLELDELHRRITDPDPRESTSTDARSRDASSHTPVARSESSSPSAVLPTRAPVPAVGCGSNSTFQCATLLPFGASDSNEFSREARYYKLELDQASRIALTLNPMPNTRYVDVRVYDSEYTRIGSKRFAAGQPGVFRVSLSGIGLYYVELDPGACCSGAPYTYTVALSR